MQVTWRRLGAVHPLTIGASTFVSDWRVLVEPLHRHNEWNLVIADVRHDDEGTYQCQVNTKDDHSHSHSHSTHHIAISTPRTTSSTPTTPASVTSTPRTTSPTSITPNSAISTPRTTGHTPTAPTTVPAQHQGRPVQLLQHLPAHQVSVQTHSVCTSIVENPYSRSYRPL